MCLSLSGKFISVPCTLFISDFMRISLISTLLISCKFGCSVDHSFLEIMNVRFSFSFFLKMYTSVVLHSTMTIYNDNMVFISKSLEYTVHHKEVAKRNRLTLL